MGLQALLLIEWMSQWPMMDSSFAKQHHVKSFQVSNAYSTVQYVFTWLRLADFEASFMPRAFSNHTGNADSDQLMGDRCRKLRLYFTKWSFTPSHPPDWHPALCLPYDWTPCDMKLVSAGQQSHAKPIWASFSTCDYPLDSISSGIVVQYSPPH